uniref:mRNA interferase RelE n=1 Tax=Klebsiella pneumoniae TaxID=573 RepID=A0A8B0SY00_KLEPN|nr:mRNA interferase RelE [Klebsiella pneumoniae]
MTYKLAFNESALKEWKKIGPYHSGTIQKEAR